MAAPVRRSERLKKKKDKKAIPEDAAVTAASTARAAKAISKNTKNIAKNTNIAKSARNDSDEKQKTKKYWLMKSEPDAFSIDDLKAKGSNSEHWDGIRNYQVRNMIRDEIQCGDEALFYHSNCKPPGVVGSMVVCRECYADHTAFDKTEKYYDPKSDPNNPRWFMFDVRFQNKFNRFISLNELKQAKELQTMRILQRGNRLSITPITKNEYEIICKMGQMKAQN
uniref:Thymocyte nuclear protein 1 n=1 Tax=Elphidium margaritaceum TaxID=933848 RepID=A0A7S0TDJ2_9EUKA